MDEKLFEKMEDYLHGKLSATEKESFEAEIAENKALAEEVELHRKLISSIEAETMRQMLEQIHTENFEKDSKVVSMHPKRSYISWAVAASLALAVLGGWWFFNIQSAQPSSLYAAYFEPASGLPTTLGSSSSTAFAEGMVSYKLEEYAEARNYWQALSDHSPQNDTLNYYIGVSYLADEMAQDAIRYLEKVKDMPSSAFQQDTQWYLALAYLLNGQTQRAKTILSEVSISNSKYQSQSQTLLEELE